MKKLNGSKKLITSVFISGTGSNLKKLINFSYKKKLFFKKRINQANQNIC